jgi:hypothetical protein
LEHSDDDDGDSTFVPSQNSSKNTNAAHNADDNYEPSEASFETWNTAEFEQRREQRERTNSYDEDAQTALLKQLLDVQSEDRQKQYQADLIRLHHSNATLGEIDHDTSCVICFSDVLANNHQAWHNVVCDNCMANANTFHQACLERWMIVGTVRCPICSRGTLF